MDVEISTAFELLDETEKKLAQAIKAKLNRDVKIHSQVDKNLIGGMVIRAGDLVIDSVRGKLHKLAEAMGSIVRQVAGNKGRGKENATTESFRNK